VLVTTVTTSAATVIGIGFLGYLLDPFEPVEGRAREAGQVLRAAIFARVLLALLCFLGLATSASAECAWVLWVLVPGNLPEWEPADAFVAQTPT